MNYYIMNYKIDLFCKKCKEIPNKVIITDGPGLLSFEDMDFNEMLFLYIDIYETNIICDKCKNMYNNKKLKDYDIVVELNDESFEDWELFSNYQEFEDRVAIITNESIDVGFEMKECDFLANVIIKNKKIYFIIDKVL